QRRPPPRSRVTSVHLNPSIPKGPTTMAEKKINGITYKVEPLTAKAALQLLARMTKVGGAAWDRLRQDIEKQSDANIGIVIVQFVVDIVRSNPSDEVVDLVDEIVSY